MNIFRIHKKLFPNNKKLFHLSLIQTFKNGKNKYSFKMAELFPSCSSKRGKPLPDEISGNNKKYSPVIVYSCEATQETAHVC